MNIALIGYGKMGKAIERLALEVDHKISLKWSGTATESNLSTTLYGSEVAIEFSKPDVAFENIMTCLKAGVPVVSGTTGWTERLAEIHAFAAEHQSHFLYASNFSVGMNILFELNKRLAAFMKQAPDFKAEIEEIHHIHKLDAPSGTAITIAEGIIASHPAYTKWGEGQQNAPILSVHSIREGEVPGTHDVRWHATSMETISLKHEAHSRDIFAKGALIAAEWLLKQKPGTYSMADVLGF